jgi:V/A-type H+-transporting ATPase subunit C
LYDIIFDPNNYPFWIILLSVLAIIIFLIIRSFSIYFKFVYPNAKFEAIGNPYIKEKELDNLSDSKDVLSFIETINKLEQYKISGTDTYSIQKSLDDLFIKSIFMMRNDSSKKMNRFFDIYLEKLDIFLIKNVLKRKIEGITIEQEKINEAILPTTKKLLLKILDSEKNNLPVTLKEYGFDEEIIKELSNEKLDFLKIDTAINKDLINRLKQIKVPNKSEKAKQKFVKTIIDINNIKNILRAKQLNFNQEQCRNLFIGEGQEIALWKYNELANLESVAQVVSGLEDTSYYNSLKNAIEVYNKEKSVQLLEVALDKHFLKLVEDISIQNYLSIGPTIRFLISKEFEIMNLKIIVKGIAENLPTDIIKKFLVFEGAT